MEDRAGSPANRVFSGSFTPMSKISLGNPAMSFPVPQISASAITNRIENTAALVQAHFDFSLVKTIVPPPEFHPLGDALSPQRRKEAEVGTSHRTARHLGALFEQILPPIPNLQKAYGSRVSDISKDKRWNPRGSSKDGVFADHAGADGTSIWAAATSGTPAMAVHLLACMLARLFSSAEAISIWYEIVEVRRKIILEGFENGLMGSITVICSQVSRQDLAQWDASARAWLQTADEVKKVQLKQLMLILDNITLPVNLGTTTYENVITAWRNAMITMERLITGQPQRITKGAVLLGLQSWHLFPDLLVLGTKATPVIFHDEQISPAGCLTIGLEDTTLADEHGIYWSLALSHLRFYGDPVNISRNLTHDSSRLTVEQVHLLALGSILASWGTFGSDEVAAAHCLIALRNCIERVPPPLKTKVEYRSLMSPNGWFSQLVQGSRLVVAPPSVDQETAAKIVRFGRRRGNRFLVDEPKYPPPLFGLSHMSIAALLADPNIYGNTEGSSKVTTMRMIAHALNLQPDVCIIRSRRPCLDPSYEYLTAFPHSDCLSSPAYRIWRETATDILLSGCSCGNKGCFPGGGCICVQHGSPCTTACHRTHGSCINILRGTVCDYLVPGTFCETPLRLNARNRWRIDFSDQQISDFFLTTRISTSKAHRPSNTSEYSESGDSICHCFQDRDGTATFDVIAGDVKDVSLLVKISSGHQQRKRKALEALNSASSNSWKDPHMMASIFKSPNADPELTLHLISRIIATSSVTLPRFGRKISIYTYNFANYMRSLNAVSISTRVYSNLPGATIASGIVSRPLHKALWIPNDPILPYQTAPLPRQNLFACIAMFESGSYNLNPEDLRNVMAISARNSLYVSKTMLADPFETSSADEVKLVIGNVGCKGLVLMVSPPALRIRPNPLDQWEQVNHEIFDGQREDTFSSTSLHLAFTGYQLPLSTDNQGSIDTELTIMETVVQVYDQGKWVGDIDPLALVRSGSRLLHRYQTSLACAHVQTNHGDQKLTSVTNWNELLDPPENVGHGCVGIVKTHDNWLGRLAVACISIQRGYRTVLAPQSQFCWTCLFKKIWQCRTSTSDEAAPVTSPHETSAERGSDGKRKAYAISNDTIPWITEGDKYHLTSSNDSAEAISDEDDDYDSDGSDDSIVTVIADVHSGIDSVIENAASNFSSVHDQETNDSDTNDDDNDDDDDDQMSMRTPSFHTFLRAQMIIL